jgi:16S rRNA (cytosine967-C5)-methyltransferase
MPSPGRAAAFRILLRVEQQQAYASELLHSSLLHGLSPADRGLCTELAMGVLRWRSRLDEAIAAVSSQPLDRLDLEVLAALRLGAYQLGWLRLPARAAVNESVELVKAARKRSAAPFANAVLRKLAAKPALLKLSRRRAASAAQLAAFYAHPAWLVERWAAAFGLEKAEQICVYGQRLPPTVVRLRDPEAESALRAESVELAPAQLLRDARRVLSGDLTHGRAYAAGRVSIQDEASQLVGLLVGQGSRLLDCCAAPGGKTAILAERNPRALIVATDLHPHRAALMRQVAALPPNVRLLTADAASLPLAADFDRVLADVPCSGTGTLARHPEIKWRLRLADLADLHQRQVAILQAALERVAPRGRLVYSTCSLERDENEDVVGEALAARSGFRLLDCSEELRRLQQSGELLWKDVEDLADGLFLRTLPGVHPCDGFFAAIIERA